MFTAYANFWKHYIDFKGRTKLWDFWWPFLFNNFVRIGFYLIILFNLVLPYQREVRLMRASALSTEGFTLWTDISSLTVVTIILWLVFELAILVPSLAIGVRRFRDAAFHWAFIFMYGGALLLSLLPLGWIFSSLLMLACIVLWAFPSREKKPKVPNFVAAGPHPFAGVAPQATPYQQANPQLAQAQAVGQQGQAQQVAPFGQVNQPVPPINPAQAPLAGQGQGANAFAQGQALGQFQPASNPIQGQAAGPNTFGQIQQVAPQDVNTFGQAQQVAPQAPNAFGQGQQVGQAPLGGVAPQAPTNFSEQASSEVSFSEAFQTSES